MVNDASAYIVAPDGRTGDTSQSSPFAVTSSASASPSHELKVRITDESSFFCCFNQSRIPLVKQIFATASLIPPGLVSEEDGATPGAGFLSDFIGDMANTETTQNIQLPRFVHFYLIAMLLNMFIEELAIPYVSDFSFWIALLMAFPMECYIYRSFHRQRLVETQAKLQEWRPLFEARGYTIDLKYDGKQWRYFADLYVHIIQRRSSSSSQQQQQPMQQQSPPMLLAPLAPVQGIVGIEQEDAKYLVLYSRMFVRRNQQWRDVLETEVNGVKPPALRPEYQQEPLHDSLFQTLLRDVRLATKAARKTRRIFHFAYWVVVILLALSLTSLWEKTLSGVLFSVPLLLAMAFMVWLDQCILLHLFPTRFPRLIDHEWQHRLQDFGYSVSYHVDQPRWYNWKESYISIRKLRPEEANKHPINGRNDFNSEMV